MAQRDQLEINVDIGEDFAAQMYWTDDDGNGYSVINPCRMDVRDQLGNLAMQFTTVNSNILSNGNFDTNTTGWGGTAANLARVTTPIYSGTGALSVTATSTSTAIAAVTNATSTPEITPANTYIASAWVRSAATARSAVAALLWYQSNGTFISQSSGTGATTTTSSWTRITATGTAPANAAYVGMQVSFLTPVANEIHYIDQAKVEVGAVVTSDSDYTTRPCITLGSTTGFIQLTAPAAVTRTLDTGRYLFDLFCSVSGTGTPYTTQLQKVVSGDLIAYQRQTIMES